MTKYIVKYIGKNRNGITGIKGISDGYGGNKEFKTEKEAHEKVKEINERQERNHINQTFRIIKYGVFIKGQKIDQNKIAMTTY